MNVSTNVAYRCYTLGEENKAIAFNTRTRKYMFLDGLSACLLNHILSNKNISRFAKENDLSDEDIGWFQNQLLNFGFFDFIQEQISFSEEDNPDIIENDEYTQELNCFIQELSNKGLYYSFHIDLTNRCNEKCIHCYHPFEKYDYSNELSTDDVKRLIDIIYELGVFSITLSGGESLLRKDFFEILKYISDKGLLTSIYTNGMLLTEDVVKQIKTFRVEIVSVSIYGDTEEVHDSITRIKGSFKKTMNGIKMLKKHHIPLGLKCVLLAKNVHHINEIRLLSERLNDGRLCKIEFVLSGKVDGDCSILNYKASEEDIAKAYLSCPEHYSNIDKNNTPTLDASPCGAGRYSLYCSADGKIYPCVAFRLYLCEYTDLKNISNNKTLNKWLMVKLSDFSNCLKHDYCKHCFRTCAGDNLVENGDYLNSSNITSCKQAKAVFELLKMQSK